MPDQPPFPGAVGASHLRVYDTVAPDGLAGGTPHLHTACTEAYYVIAGTGAVQTLTVGGYEEVGLSAGAFVWFTPGTIHRLVNAGDLEIVVLMQNAGLPEAGDMVITFAPDHLVDREAYEAVASLPDGQRTTAGGGDAARSRRDLGVEGFVPLRDATVAGNPGPLRAFHAAATRLIGPRLPEFLDRWSAGPVAEAERTGDILRALATGDPSHLADASVHHLSPPGDERVMGCCGTLGTYVPQV